MRTAVWSALFVLACCRPGTADVPVQPNFDPSQMAGRWYLIRMALEAGHGLKVVNLVGRTASALPNGDIDVVTDALVNGQCTSKTTTFLHTDTPGVYTTIANSKARMVETDYTTYNILHVETEGRQVLHLEVRKLDGNEAAIEKFGTLAASMGFPEDNIMTMTPAGPCPK